MSADLREKARDFIESIASGDPGPRRVAEPSGVIDHRLVRRMLFVVICLTIVAVAAAAILAVWDLLTPEVAWKISLTFLIGVLSFALFCLANEAFAER